MFNLFYVFCLYRQSMSDLSMSDLFNLVLPDVYRFIVVRGLFDVNAVSRDASATIMRERRLELYGQVMCYECLVIMPDDPPNCCYCGDEHIVPAPLYVRASFFCLPEDVWSVQHCNLCYGHFIVHGHFDPQRRCYCYRWNSSVVARRLIPLPMRSISR